jgi:3-oxoacyl-[acyl-carrier protein] reductase
MFDLTGKTALVTGATGGIGGAIARAFHDRGATVVLSGTRQDALAELKAELGANAHAIACNLGDGEAVAALPGQVEELTGQLDILVNNAGITRDGLLMRMKDEDWDTVMDINLKAAFQLSRAAIKGMMRRRFGRVISITSVVGVTGNPGQANYAASKAGIIGFSKALAREVASRNITVNCIAPGFIETAMTDALNDKQKQAILASIPSGRLGTVDEVASGAIYLSSDEAAYMTGQTLHVNGGMAMI